MPILLRVAVVDVLALFVGVVAVAVVAIVFAFEAVLSVGLNEPLK